MYIYIYSEINHTFFFNLPLQLPCSKDDTVICHNCHLFNCNNCNHNGNGTCDVNNFRNKRAYSW